MNSTDRYSDRKECQHKAVAVFIINVFQDIPLTICDGNCKSCFLRTYQILISHISGDLRIFHSGLQHSHSHFHRTDACKISPGKCLSCSFGKHLIQGVFDRVFIFSADIMGIIARNKASEASPLDCPSITAP